jgi:hypothetical protein
VHSDGAAVAVHPAEDRVELTAAATKLAVTASLLEPLVEVGDELSVVDADTDADVDEFEASCLFSKSAVVVIKRVL